MSKQRTFFYAVLISLSLHCTLFLQWRFTPLAKDVIQPIELSHIQSSSLEKGLGSGKKGGTGRRLPMKNLLPTPEELNFSFQKSLAQKGSGTGEGNGEGQSNGEGNGLDGGWITAVGVDQYLPIMQYSQEVWQHINQNIHYPDEYAKLRISGSVHVRVVLNPDGTLDGDFRKLTSDHHLLEIYVLSVLLSILDKPFVKENHRPSTKTAMNLQFQFQTATEKVFLEEEEGNTRPHALLFKRTKIVPSVLEQKFEEIVSKYFPPILVIGPMVYVDVFRAYQFVASIGEPSQNEKDTQRLHALTEKLKSTIRQKKSVHK